MAWYSFLQLAVAVINLTISNLGFDGLVVTIDKMVFPSVVSLTFLMGLGQVFVSPLGKAGMGMNIACGMQLVNLRQLPPLDSQYLFLEMR